MKRRYIVLRPFKANKYYYPGNIIPHEDLIHIPLEVIKENVYIQDFTDINLALNYGSIFLSKEYPFPKGQEEETLEEIRCKLIKDMKKCCCGSHKSYLNKECAECTDYNYCKECNNDKTN